MSDPISAVTLTATEGRLVEAAPRSFLSVSDHDVADLMEQIRTVPAKPAGVLDLAPVR